MDIYKLLSQMSIEEKLGQLTELNSACFKENDAEIAAPSTRAGIDPEDVKYAGSVLNFIGADLMHKIQDIAMAKQPHRIPLLFMQDVIHGYRTIYPIPLAMGCSFDVSLMEECAAMAASEAAASGVGVTFSPMVDLSRDARWGRCMESTGEDVFLNCEMARAQVRGYQGETLSDKSHIAACVKHFAAYGAVEAGRDYNAVELTERTLRESYLPAYRAAVDAGAKMVMTSYNTIGNLPSTENKHLLTDILRGEWGFDGTVISDYNAYREIVRHGALETDKEAAFAALDAGCDIEMAAGTAFTYGKEFISSGALDMDRLDKAVLRVLALKDEMGLFDDAYRGASAERENELFLSEKHREISRRAAEESAVLLKNNGVLPFSDKVRRVALIGPFANEKGIKGFWACAGRDDECVSVYDGVRALLGDAKIECVPACSHDIYDDDESGIKAAVRSAIKADAVVLCLGEHQSLSGEGNSRATLELSHAQMALARAVCASNKNTAVLLFCGRPLVLTELDKIAPAILNMWQPGSEGGNAAARLLFGYANPCGRLSMSFPWCTGQEPIYYAHQPTARPVENPKIIDKNGYISRYVDAPCDPLYVFGHGLSYTEFSYGDIMLSSDKLTEKESIFAEICVKNIGKRAGKETVQLYIRDNVGSVARPVKELRGFEKISLEPGESKTVRFEIGEKMLRYFGKDNVFSSDAGTFTLYIGHDSDEKNHVTFTLEK